MHVRPEITAPAARWLQGQWRRKTPWHILLWPPSLVFGMLVSLRRVAYRMHWLPATKLPVPLVVVGNVTVGGTGKTPLVLWLVELLRAEGWRPGIISRGYGGAAATPQAVKASSAPALLGDEPVLLARRAGCPVWVGRDRVAVAHGLLAAHPEVNVLVSDDGLQHYRLQRDVEIAVLDGMRGLGNGLLLPAGPLRERARRLNEVDAVVVNGGQAQSGRGTGQYAMHLHGEVFYNLLQPALTATAADFRGKVVHALAGIGNPARFFAHLRKLGLSVVAHPFPDHHPYRPQDLALQGVVLMTEKDAVKCAQFATAECWVLAVAAEVDPGLGRLILDKLGKIHGQ
jgi:tetraacyldisaccharide 4'-kinase